MKKVIFIFLALVSALSIHANSIAVQKAGKGSPLIIIAGLGGTEVWQTSIQKLSALHTTYLISIKGLNGEKNISEPDFSAMKREIVSFIEKEKISEGILLGHSLGGFLAMQLAVENPSFFKRLVIVDACPFSLAVYNPAFTGEFGAQQGVTLKKQLIELPESAYSAFWKQNVQIFTPDTAYQRTILQNIINSERKFVAEAQSYVLSNDLRLQLKSIQCPVLVLCSSFAYNTVGVSGDLLKERITNQFSNVAQCDIFISDKARHFIMLDSPEWFMEKVQSI